MSQEYPLADQVIQSATLHRAILNVESSVQRRAPHRDTHPIYSGHQHPRYYQDVQPPRSQNQGCYPFAAVWPDGRQQCRPHQTNARTRPAGVPPCRAAWFHFARKSCSSRSNLLCHRQSPSVSPKPTQAMAMGSLSQTHAPQSGPQ